MFKQLSLVIGLAIAASPALAQHGHDGSPAGHRAVMSAPAPESISVPANGVTVPIRDSAGRAVVMVKINGKGPYPFLLGSSANLTVIDTALDSELRLAVAEGMQAAPSGGHAPTIVQLDELRIGDAAVRGFIGAVMPLRDLLGSEPGAPRGIVSASIFQGYLITYDFPAARISIAKGKLDGDDKVSTFEYSEGRPTLPVRIGGREARVGLDTASRYGLTLPMRMISEVPLAEPAKPNGSRRTTAGEFPASTAPLTAAVEIGPHKLPIKQVSFSDARAGGGPATGSIGVEALRGFVVTLDTWNHRIRVSQ